MEQDNKISMQIYTTIVSYENILNNIDDINNHINIILEYCRYIKDNINIINDIYYKDIIYYIILDNNNLLIKFSDNMSDGKYKTIIVDCISFTIKNISVVIEDDLLDIFEQLNWLLCDIYVDKNKLKNKFCILKAICSKLNNNDLLENQNLQIMDLIQIINNIMNTIEFPVLNSKSMDEIIKLDQISHKIVMDYIEGNYNDYSELENRLNTIYSDNDDDLINIINNYINYIDNLITLFMNKQDYIKIYPLIFDFLCYRIIIANDYDIKYICDNVPTEFDKLLEKYETIITQDNDENYEIIINKIDICINKLITELYF